MPTIRFTIKVNNVFTDPDSVVLEDPAGTYGVKRNDTDAVIAAAGTAMDKVSTGIYEYAFEDPADDLTYSYYVKYVLNGATYYSEGEMVGAASSGLDGLLEDTREVLEDSSKAIFSDSAVTRAVNTAILAASVYVPYESKESKTFSAGSTDIDVSDITGLRKVLRAEYPVGESPKEYRNVSCFGDTVEIDTSLIPSEGDAVYLYCLKNHTAATLTGELKPVVADYAAGLCALNWVGEGRSQIKAAVSALSDVNSSVDGMSTGMAAAETALSTMCTAIGSVSARITEAMDNLDSQEISISEVDAVLASLEGDLTSAASAIASGSSDISTALSEIDSKISDVEARITAGLALNNTITIGANPEEMQVSYAKENLDIASLHVEKVKALMSRAGQSAQYAAIAGARAKEAVAIKDKAASFRDKAIGELEAGKEYLLQAAQYASNAGMELKVANSCLAQSGGYVREVSSRISVVGVIQAYQKWGKDKIEQAIRELRGMQRARVYREYPDG